MGVYKRGWSHAGTEGARAAAAALLLADATPPVSEPEMVLRLVRDLAGACGGHVRILSGERDKTVIYRLAFKRKHPRATRHHPSGA
jgi:hypothetical protein